MVGIKIKPKEEKVREFQRGKVYWVRFDKVKKEKSSRKDTNTEIGNPRPAVVISNDFQNRKSKRVIIVPLSRTTKPFYEEWEVYSRFNNEKGKLMCDQIRGIDKEKRLGQELGTLDSKTLKEVEEKLLEVLELAQAISNKQLLLELARRIKEKEIDWESILAGIEEI